MKYFLILIGFFYSNFSQTANTDIVIKEHPLNGKTITTPDFTLVVGGRNDSYSQSPVIKKVDGRLVTLDHRSSTIGFPAKGLYTKDVLSPNFKLKVKEVYRSKPSLIRSGVAGDMFFAIVSDKNGKKYTVPVFEEEIFFELNGCRANPCRNWMYQFKSILQSSNKELQFQLTYFLLDSAGMTILKDIRPQLPKGTLKRSQEKLVTFLKNKKIPIININEYHPFISIKANLLQLGDLFLNFESLGIKSVSILEK